VNADGTITVDNPTTTGKVNYTPNDAKANVTIPSNQGDQTVPDVTGKTGDKVNVDVPPIEGYTPDKTTVPATVNADGTITVDNPTTTGKVNYTPNDAKANVTIPSNQGDQTVPDVTGKTGDKVNVDVPPIEGYTPDKTTVPATVNPDGTITVDNPTTTGKVTYTPNTVTTDVTVPTNEGDQTVPGITGKTGEHVDVTVPVKPGYTADKTTVPATVNPDGTITVDNPTTTGKVTYTPNAVTTDGTVSGNENDQAVTDTMNPSNENGQTVTGTTDSSDESGQAVTAGTDETNKKTVASVSQQNSNINV
ncbi:hypothetical protein ACFP1H_08755, partial [Secundilactobacillus hailunensis]